MTLVLACFIGCGSGGESAPKGSGGGGGDGGGVASADGCGCGDGSVEGAGSYGDGVEREYTPASGTASVKGVAKFEGEAPRRRPIDTGSEKYCQEHGEILTEAAIVGEKGELANVFVQVKKGLKEWVFPPATEPALVHQEGCTYVPHVLGMRTHQSLVIRNDDPIMHNVHIYDLRTGKTHDNFAQAKKGMETSRTFKRPIDLQFKCDVHGWMSSYVRVVNHPFFVVTGEDGAFNLEKLPAGEYEIEAWHEKYGVKTETVTLENGEVKTLTFTFTK